MGFSRQEYRSGLPYPSPGYLPHPGIKPRSPALHADIFPSEPPGKQVGREKREEGKISQGFQAGTLKKEWQPTPVSLPGKPHEQRSLVGYSPWSCKRVRQDLVTRQQQLYNRKGPEKRERGWSESEKYPWQWKQGSRKCRCWKEATSQAIQAASPSWKRRKVFSQRHRSLLPPWFYSCKTHFQTSDLLFCKIICLSLKHWVCDHLFQQLQETLTIYIYVIDPCYL